MAYFTVAKSTLETQTKSASENGMCNICNTPVQPVNMQSHLRGRKHKQLLMELKKANNKNSTTIKETGRY